MLGCTPKGISQRTDHDTAGDENHGKDAIQRKDQKDRRDKTDKGASVRPGDVSAIPAETNMQSQVRALQPLSVWLDRTTLNSFAGCCPSAAS